MPKVEKEPSKAEISVDAEKEEGWQFKFHFYKFE